MPKIHVNGVNLHYEEHGAGAETIVFSHGLLWSGRMFEKQVEALKDRYCCITYDHRGQGQTEVTRSGYDIDTLTEDAAALIAQLGAAPCHFVGLSMGGFVGQRLAIRRPELLHSLTLIETSADPEPGENAPKYRLLGLVGRYLGFGLVADRVMPIMFGRTFMTDPARAEERDVWRRYLIANDRTGIYRALMGVINRQGVYDQMDRIDLPTLIIVGDEDVATIPAKSERMHDRIKGSRLVRIPQAGHTSTVENPTAVNAALAEFLATVRAPVAA